MFNLKCTGEINGKEITLIPGDMYSIRYRDEDSNYMKVECQYKTFLNDKIFVTKYFENYFIDDWISIEQIQSIRGYREDLYDNQDI